MRAAQHRIYRQLDGAKFDQRIDQLVDRRLPEVREGGMGRAPRGAQLQTENPARRETEAIVSRLAVDQETAAVGSLVRGPRAVAPPLFADDKDQTDAPFALADQPIRGRDLRGENAFRIA